MLSIERSGYYAWVARKPGERQLANKALDKKIISIFYARKSRYGAPRLTKELNSLGEICSKNRVFRRMHHLGLKAKAKKNSK